MVNYILKAVLQSTSEIVVVSCAGVWLSRQKIVGRGELKQISMMIEQLFTPALIFSNFMLNLDTLDIFSWLPVFICATIIIMVQMGVAYGFNRLIIKDQFYSNMIIVGNGLVNTTGIQLVLIRSLQTEFDLLTVSLFGDVHQFGQTSEQRGYYYVMLTTLIHTLSRWTIGKVALGNCSQPPQYKTSQYQQQQQQIQFQQQQQLSFSNNQNHQPHDDDYKYKNSFTAFYYQILDFLPSIDPDTFKKMFNFPIKVSLFSMLLCAIPPLKNLFVHEDSVLRIIIIDPLISLGNVYSVFILLFLGSNIYLLDPKTALISTRTIIYTTILKLIISPLVGLYTLKLFIDYQLCTKDPVLIFIYIVNFASPTAINLLTIATTYSKVGDDMAKLLTFQYFCYLAILPILIHTFLNYYL